MGFRCDGGQAICICITEQQQRLVAANSLTTAPVGCHYSTVTSNMEFPWWTPGVLLLKIECRLDCNTNNGCKIVDSKTFDILTLNLAPSYLQVQANKPLPLSLTLLI